MQLLKSIKSIIVIIKFCYVLITELKPLIREIREDIEEIKSLKLRLHSKLSDLKQEVNDAKKS